MTTGEYVVAWIGFCAVVLAVGITVASLSCGQASQSVRVEKLPASQVGVSCFVFYDSKNAPFAGNCIRE